LPLLLCAGCNTDALGVSGDDGPAGARDLAFGWPPDDLATLPDLGAPCVSAGDRPALPLHVERPWWPAGAPVLAAGDADGDGLGDLIELPLSFRKGHGDGTFASPVQLAQSQCEDARLLDLDRDGRTDVIAIANGYKDSQIVAVPGKANGPFAPARTSALPENAVCYHVGDFDGDGKLDVAAGHIAGWSFHHGAGDGDVRRGRARAADAGVAARSDRRLRRR
jgi:hypothetical protein